jgi:flagellar biosynthesis protein FlhB
LFAKVLVDYYILIYSHWQELVKSMGSTGSYSLPNMMKVMVWFFMSDADNVLTALIVVVFILVLLEVTQYLPSKCYLEWSL